MLSFGTCVVGAPERHQYAELQLLYPDLWDVAAEKIHGLSREYLRRNGEDPRVVMEAHRRWVLAVSEGRIPVYCGWPLVYDWGSMQWYLTHTGVENPYQEQLDVKDLYRKIKGLERHEKVSGDQIRADFPTKLIHDHNSLHDALEQGDRIAQMLRIAHWL